jgi:peptidoglycan/xylan/chitin deacetylase (PgdA/CDA1 family)
LALYAVTAGGIVLTGRALLIAPPPFPWAVAALLAYGAFVLVGVMDIRLRVFCDAIVRGPKGARGVALTFDDGPHPVWTRKVLDALDEAGAKGTFFLIGKKAEAYPDVVEDILRRGHTVGLHSYAHDRLFALRSEKRVRADLERGIDVLTKLTGERPTLFRPPIGHTNPVIARVADALDLTVVGWTLSGRDGLARAKLGKVLGRIRHGAKDGAIVALHDAAERGDFEPVVPKGMTEILAVLVEERVEVVPLEPWAGQADA